MELIIALYVLSAYTCTMILHRLDSEDDSTDLVAAAIIGALWPAVGFAILGNSILNGFKWLFSPIRAKRRHRPKPAQAGINFDDMAARYAEEHRAMVLEELQGPRVQPRNPGGVTNLTDDDFQELAEEDRPF